MNLDLVTLFWGSNPRPLHDGARPGSGLLSSVEPAPALKSAATASSQFWSNGMHHLGNNGGLLWDTAVQGGQASVRIASSTGGGAYVPASRVWQLKGTGEIAEHPIQHPGIELSLGVGDQLLLPVSQEAEAELQGFLQSLMSLDSRHRANLYQALRRPSIEARMDRLERAVRRLGETGGALTGPVAPNVGTTSSKTKGGGGFGKATVFMTGVGALVLGLCIGAGVMGLLGTQTELFRGGGGSGSDDGGSDEGGGSDDGGSDEGSGSDDGGGTGGTGGSSAGGDAVGGGASGGGGGGDAAAAAQNAQALGLLTKLSNEAVGGTAESWAISQTDLKEDVLDGNTVTETGAWGVLKLALQLQGAVVVQLKGGPETWNAVPESKIRVADNNSLRPLLRDDGGLAKLQSDPEVARAMAAVFCNAFNKPGVRTQPRIGEIMPLSTHHPDCGNLSLGSAVPGLTILDTKLAAAKKAAAAAAEGG